jgi:hypothetical protein
MGKDDLYCWLKFWALYLTTNEMVSWTILTNHIFKSGKDFWKKFWALI